MLLRFTLIITLLSCLPATATDLVAKKMTEKVTESEAILSVSGVGQVSMMPDMASISVGVEVEAPTADRALKLNSARMRAIFATLEERGIAKRDIQTSQFSLHPQWSSRNASTGKPPKITGFVASNVVSIKVRQLDLLGSVLDALTKSGANRIQGVQFALSNPGPGQDEARKRAVAEALRKGRLYAEAAGGTLGPILTLSEGGNAAQPSFRMEARAMSDAVPIAEGALILRAEVSIEFSLK